jgi:hypothetical protein
VALASSNSGAAKRISRRYLLKRRPSKRDSATRYERILSTYRLLGFTAVFTSLITARLYSRLTS